MKILWRKIGRDKSGAVRVNCEEPEDFWHIYNLIRVGDVIVATTLRKVIHTTSTGSTSSNKVKITLSLRIDEINFDTDTCTIRVKGRNIKENKYVSLGQSHTSELALERPFTIEKALWDSIDLDRLHIAADPSKSAELAVIVMEEGLAHLVLITSHMSITRAKIERTIPRKRMGSATRHDKAVLRFYEMIIDAIMRHIDFEIIKCVVIASPGFVKDDFITFMWKYAAKDESFKVLFNNKSKFITAHASSGHKYSVNEILNDRQMQKILADTKASEEVKLLDDFFKLLNVDETRAIYGFEYIRRANDSKAIQTLLITDKLFRSADLKQRKTYVAMVDSIRKNGADIKLFSSLHVSGEQLDQITGIAAFLRFPMPELLELGDDDSDEDDNGSNDQSDVDSEEEHKNPRYI